MGRRVFPALFVFLAALADFRGSHGVAFDLLLVAVPCAAVAGLSAFGSFLDARGDGVAALRALGWGLVVLLLTLSCTVRSSAVHALPPVAFSTVVACLAIFVVQAVVEAVPSFGRPARRTRTAAPPSAVTAEPVAELRRAS